MPFGSGPMGRQGRQYRGAEVYVNVYDLSPMNQWSHSLGFGVFHSGVEVHGREWSYGGNDSPVGADTANSNQTGVFSMEPKEVPNAPFRCSILMGETSLTAQQIDEKVATLQQRFLAKEYNIMSKNCNVFAEELVYALLGKLPPPWINRMARWGSCCSCCFPKPSQLNDTQAEEHSFVPFQGQGNVLASPSEAVPLTQETRRERMAQAAMHRLAAEME